MSGHIICYCLLGRIREVGARYVGKGGKCQNSFIDGEIIHTNKHAEMYFMSRREEIAACYVRDVCVDVICGENMSWASWEETILFVYLCKKIELG